VERLWEAYGRDGVEGVSDEELQEALAETVEGGVDLQQVIDQARRYRRWIAMAERWPKSPVNWLRDGDYRKTWSLKRLPERYRDAVYLITARPLDEMTDEEIEKAVDEQYADWIWLKQEVQ
jgi:hypothetical protein